MPYAPEHRATKAAAKQLAYKAEKRAWLAKYFHGRPCEDCGQTFHLEHP